MKRHFIILILLLIAGVFIGAGMFAWRNLRGWRPALGPIPSVTAHPTRTDSEAQSVNTTGLPLELPDGISIAVFADKLAGARVLALDSEGTLLVSIPQSGRVVALPDGDNDGVADRVVPVISGLNLPHGLALRDGRLFIAETDGVSSYAYDASRMQASGRVHVADLPAGGNHYTRTIAFGPDGRLYISVGSSCNVCTERDWRRAKILVADPDGTNLREYATGLRNSVFFTWHPQTGDMWATDMGRDLLGDNTPPEEVNIVKDGSFYGWPYCYGNRVHDRDFDPSEDAKTRCESSISPHITFQAHSAPLGLAFVPDSWPEEYRGDLLVASHGSWNRTEPTGYKIVRFNLNEQLQSTGESDFISGWLTQGGALGRPVDLLFSPDGALYVSDDKAGNIYHVTISRR